MQNLINFIWKYHFAFLFLLLELVSVGLLVHYNNYQQSSFLASANEVSGSAYSIVKNITGYLELKKVNEELAKDNARLRTLNNQSFIQTNTDTVEVNDTVNVQQYIYTGAKVVNNTLHKRANYIILDKGMQQGIEPDMAVINATGIVGIVKDVSQNYCAVLSLLHKDSEISVKLKNNDYFGPLTWQELDAANEATLSDIPSHVIIAIGDSVVTRGSSGIFPKNILVGTIISFEEVPGSGFYETKVRLSANFNNLSYCYIVKNLLRAEQLELEEKVSE